MYLSTAPFIRTFYLQENMVEAKQVSVEDENGEKKVLHQDNVEMFETLAINLKQPSYLTHLLGDDNTMFNRFFTTVVFRHSFFLMMGVFIISFSEDRILSGDPQYVNLWYVLFEIISAYGGVGMSLGYPGKRFSMIGMMSYVAKYVVIFVMMLGKHRCMPSEGDDIIDFTFPGLREASVLKENEDEPRDLMNDIQTFIRRATDHGSNLYAALSGRRSTMDDEGIIMTELDSSLRGKRTNGTFTMDKEKLGGVLPLSSDVMNPMMPMIPEDASPPTPPSSYKRLGVMNPLHQELY